MMDLRYALRSLRSTPVFTSVAVLTLAVGIGANITIFSIVNGVLLRPLNYGQPDELVAIFATERVRGEQRNPMSPADFLDLRASSSSIDLQTAAVPWSPVMTGRGSAAQIQGLKASAGLFDLLGVAPALGRTFAPGDREAVGGRVVVLSHGLWLREFGGAPGAVGEVITLEREPYTVVGVMPAGFEFPPFWATGAEFWAPLDLSSSVATERRARYLRAFGRLRSGVSVEAARAEVEAQAQALEEAHPESNAGVGATVESLHEPVVGPVRPALVLLAAAVGFVLLVACANVANLLLARGAVRRREIAIRRAIGATRGRIARLLVVSFLVGQRTHEIGLRLALGAEHSHILGLIVGRGLALAAGGVAAGVLGALTMSRFLESLLFRVDPADPLTLVVTSTVVVAVAALACYVPARRALRIDPIAALRE